MLIDIDFHDYDYILLQMVTNAFDPPLELISFNFDTMLMYISNFLSNIYMNMLIDFDFHDYYYTLLQMIINAFDPPLESISFKRFCLKQC